jgi:hypothetical protein
MILLTKIFLSAFFKDFTSIEAAAATQKPLPQRKQ